MRNILFRGKRMDNREWVEGGSVIRFDPENNQELVFMPHMHEGCISTHDDDDNITAFESGIFYKVDPATVGQYTGLTDKNGKKIYEGDICRNTKTNEIVSVKWHGTMAGYVWSKRRADNGNLYDFGELFRAFDKYEVIGNIHDNPDLMGGAENVSHP